MPSGGAGRLTRPVVHVNRERLVRRTVPPRGGMPWNDTTTAQAGAAASLSHDNNNDNARQPYDGHVRRAPPPVGRSAIPLCGNRDVAVCSPLSRLSRPPFGRDHGEGGWGGEAAVTTRESSQRRDVKEGRAQLLRS
jgi:hypothetical protein